jgi:hypothetical protein
MNEIIYGSNFSFKSPGRNPNSSPGNCVTDLTNKIFLYLVLALTILSASAHAIKVLPVPGKPDTIVI